MRIRNYFYAVFALALMATSCTSNSNDVPQLEGKWNIVLINGANVEAEEVPFIEFLPENKIHSNLGCNILNTTIVTEEGTNKLIFEDGPRTLMMCPDMPTEDAILQALFETQKYQKTENGIAFVDENNNQVLELQKCE